MSLPSLAQLALDIDSAISPKGGEPLITSQRLNAILQETVAVLGAGAAATEALPYAELQARLAAATLVPGRQYRVTKRPSPPTLGTAGEVVLTATAADAVAAEGLLCAHVPDYSLPLWRTNYFTPGPVTGTSYTQQTSGYVPVVPRFFDAVDRHVVGDDFITPPFTLPFPFVFGGVTYTQAQIDTNGRMVFGPTATTSNHQQRLGSGDQPLIAFAWCDLVVTGATFSTFVTGEAPNRKFVLDYQHARLFQRYFLGGRNYDTQDVTTGQIVLEETTNRISIGIATNLNADTNVVQGIQYAGHGYNLSEGMRLPDNTLTTFTPVTERGPATEVVVPASHVVVWQGRTWALAEGGNAQQEPGTGPDWVPAAGAGADAFGNAQPTFDAVAYAVATDTISARRDARGNYVRGAGSLDTFPWGHPGAQDNTLRGTTLDASLRNTPGLVFMRNTLVDCVLEQVNLTGVACTDNQLYGVELRHYTPTQFDHVAAYYGFDAGITATQHQVYVQGVAVRPELPQLEAGLGVFKDKFLDSTFITYRAGQVPSYAPLDLLDAFSTDYTPHDLIVVRGATTRSLCLRNQDYNVRGEGAVCGGLLPGAGTGPRKITVDSVTFTGGVGFGESDDDGSGKGHDIHLLNCVMPNISQFQGSGNGYRDRHTLTNCTFGNFYRSAAYNGSFGHKFAFNRCTIGRDLRPAAGSQQALLDTYDGGTLSLQISNSVLYLNDGVTLEPAGRHSVAPYLTFENCTLLYADGTVKSLSTSAPVYQLDTTRHAADVAALTDPSHWNAAGNGEYTGPALQFSFPAYYEAFASAAGRGYRYVLDGQGHAARYAA